MINDITAWLCAVFEALPYEVKVGLVVVAVLLICGYENKRRADIEAEEAAARRAARKSKKTTTNNGEDTDVRY